MKDLRLNELVNLGGHRFSVNDLSQLMQATQQMAQIFGESFGQAGTGGIALVGIKETTTATDISYSGGWLFKDGFMWKVNPLPPQTITAGQTIYFVFKTVNNAPPVTYQGGGQHQVHIERQIDILYTSSSHPIISQGTLNIDFTSPFYVRFERIEDLINRLAANTAHRELVENAAWAELDGGSIANSLITTSSNIPSGVAPNSRVRYKIIGKQLYLQVSLILTAPSPKDFSLNLPSTIELRNALQPSVLALDSIGSVQPCAVGFTANTSSSPAIMNFSRGHNDTTENTVSFFTILELA